MSVGLSKLLIGGDFRAIDFKGFRNQHRRRDRAAKNGLGFLFLTRAFASRILRIHETDTLDDFSDFSSLGQFSGWHVGKTPSQRPPAGGFVAPAGDQSLRPLTIGPGRLSVNAGQ